MRKNVTICEEQTHTIQEVVKPGKMRRFKSWYNAKVCPKIKSTVERISGVTKKTWQRLLKIKISWISVLAIVILVNMAEKGMMDNIPQIKWLVESVVRFIEWGIGVLHNLLKWIVDLLVLDFGIFKMFEEWVRQIFAL